VPNLNLVGIVAALHRSSSSFSNKTATHAVHSQYRWLSSNVVLVPPKMALNLFHFERIESQPQQSFSMVFGTVTTPKQLENKALTQMHRQTIVCRKRIPPHQTALLQGSPPYSHITALESGWVYHPDNWDAKPPACKPPIAK